MATRILKVAIPGDATSSDELDIFLSEGYRVVNHEPIGMADTHILMILYKEPEVDFLGAVEAARELAERLPSILQGLNNE